MSKPKLPKGVTVEFTDMGQGDFTPAHRRYAALVTYEAPDAPRQAMRPGEVLLVALPRQETFPYQTAGEPQAVDLLDCLVRDLAHEDPSEFDEIAGDMPYSEAREMHQQLIVHADQMRALFGADLDRIVTEVEGWEL